MFFFFGPPKTILGIGSMVSLTDDTEDSFRTSTGGIMSRLSTAATDSSATTNRTAVNGHKLDTGNNGMD